MTDLLGGLIGIIAHSMEDILMRRRIVWLYWDTMLRATIGITEEAITPEMGAFIVRYYAPEWLRRAVEAYARDVIHRFYSGVISTVGIPIAEFYSEVRNRIISLIPSEQLREALIRRDVMLLDAIRGYSNLLGYIPDFRLERMEKEFFSKLLRRERVIDEPTYLRYLRDMLRPMPFHPKDKKDIAYAAMKEMGIQPTKEKLKYVLGYDYYRAQGYP